MKYEPINCSLYDYLEMWAIKKTPLQIEYQAKGESITLSHSFIETLQTKNKNEYLILTDKTIIRLDKLIRINDIDFTIRSC